MELNRREVCRQLVHLLGFVLVVLASYIGGLYTGIVSLASCVFIIILSWWTVEKHKVREKWPLRIKKIEELEDKSHDIINNLEREYEIQKRPYYGALLFFFSIGIVFVVFPLEVAVISTLVLSFGDSSATLVGIHIGKHRLPHNTKKSYEGSLAFFVPTFLISFYFLSFGSALIFSLLITLVESVPVVDDNLSVPFMSALLYFLIFL